LSDLGGRVPDLAQGPWVGGLGWLGLVGLLLSLGSPSNKSAHPLTPKRLASQTPSGLPPQTAPASAQPLALRLQAPAVAVVAAAAAGGQPHAHARAQRRRARPAAAAVAAAAAGRPRRSPWAAPRSGQRRGRRPAESPGVRVGGTPRGAQRRMRRRRRAPAARRSGPDGGGVVGEGWRLRAFPEGRRDTRLHLPSKNPGKLV
jgi:hypothetical protein